MTPTPDTAPDEPAGVPEPRDTWGPSGTYGCACKSRDARNCAMLHLEGAT